MEIVYKKLDELVPYKNNPRYNDDAVEYVANSIKEFGFKVPIIIDKNNEIVAGHTRYKASIELGLKEVPTIMADDLNEEQIKAFRLADKKVKTEEFLDFIKNGTNMCKEIGFKLWGVNLNKDALNYKHNLPFNTKSIILGPFSCHLKGSEIRYDEKIPLKEDYDLAIQHLNKYRGILRFNKYHYNCKQSIQTGGCATYRNRDKEKEQLDLLIKKWGSKIVKKDKTNKGKKEKMYEDYNPVIHIPIKGV